MNNIRQERSNEGRILNVKKQVIIKQQIWYKYREVHGP